MKNLGFWRYLVALATLCLLIPGLAPRVLPAAAASSPPRIVLHAGGSAQPIVAVDRSRFLVDAQGFQSGESIKIQATFSTYSGNDIVQTRTATANGQGNVSNVAMYAPGGAKAGWAILTAAGQGSKKQAQGRVWVTYRPYIYLNNQSITAGSAVAVNGRGFVSDAQVRVEVTVQSGGSPQTISVMAGADTNGNFTKWIRIPGYTSTGSYTIAATDTIGGFKRYAKLAVTTHPAPKATATPTPTATPKPSIHASARVFPAATLPNQDVTFSGNGFPANTTVTVSVTVDMTSGGNRYIAKTATTDSNGNFATAFRVPYKAAPGTYTVTGSASGAQATDSLQVLPLSAHPHNLSFRWVSLWYHTVRQGTWDYLDIQSTMSTQLGVWVHVIFPSGQHYDYYTVTDHNGRWSMKFTIPKQSTSRHSNQAYITFQLWHGKQTTQAFVDFTLV